MRRGEKRSRGGHSVLQGTGGGGGKGRQVVGWTFPPAPPPEGGLSQCEPVACVLGQEGLQLHLGWRHMLCDRSSHMGGGSNQPGVHCAMEEGWRQKQRQR